MLNEIKPNRHLSYTRKETPMSATEARELIEIINELVEEDIDAEELEVSRYTNRHNDHL